MFVFVIVCKYSVIFAFLCWFFLPSVFLLFLLQAHIAEQVAGSLPNGRQRAAISQELLLIFLRFRNS